MFWLFADGEREREKFHAPNENEDITKVNLINGRIMVGAVGRENHLPWDAFHQPVCPIWSRSMPLNVAYIY